MIRVYISRKLGGDSPIRSVCNAHQIKLHDHSLLKFELIPYQTIALTPWIFFYSKNGVKFFFEQLQMPISENVKYGAMGKPTADAIQAYDTRAIAFIGKGAPAKVATQFQSILEGGSVLFVKAKYSRSSIEKKMIGITKFPLIVYNNSVVDNLPMIVDTDIIMLTSPMNATTYLSNYEVPPKAKIIAIGPTTAKEIHANTHHNILIAKEPTEASMATLLSQLF